MSIIEAIINGAIQGLTEFLPVSSSGHLSLVQYFTGRGEDAGLIFVVLLHMGTLLAVFMAFWKTIWELIAEFFKIIVDIFTGRFRFSNMSPPRRMVFLLIVSLLPMAASLLLLDTFDAIATDNDIIIEGICFLITSVMLFVSVKCVSGHKTAKDMQYRDALVIGAVQAVAPIPGISRSGSTISAGIFMGLNRQYAIAFSFIMGVPTVLGANILEMREVMQEGLTVPVPALAAGIIASLAFGLIAIKLVKWLLASDKFIYFAWYTLILGAVTIIAGIAEKLNGHALQGLVTGMMG